MVVRPIGCRSFRYEPLGERRVRFSSGSFSADIEFDGDGFVVNYPGIARRA